MSDEEEAAQFAEALLGFRVWAINADGLLRPYAINGGPWQAGSNRARCATVGHDAPHPHCGCGFNALHRPPYGYAGDVGHAVGAIAAWGEVDLFRTGFRAEFAAVVALGLPRLPTTAHRDRLERAARHYGVPLVPLRSLPGVASEFARPVASEHLPGRRRAGKRREGGPREHLQPLPKAALCAAMAGNGVWIDKHVALAHKGRTVRLGPTPALVAASGGRVAPRVRRYQELAEGEPLLAVGADGRLVCPSPLAGRVLKVRTPEAGELASGPAESGWIVEVQARNESPDHWPVAWGIVGADEYRRLVLDHGSDARVLAALAAGGHVHTALSAQRAWLTEFAGRMGELVAGERALGEAIERLGLDVGFRLADGGGLRVAPGRIEAGEPGPEVDVCLELEPEAFVRYWRGTLSLARDQVSTGSYRTGRFEHAAEAPVHIAAGTPGQARLAMSIHRRLFRGATAIIDELGDPWFRAGDAVRDPQRNRAALAGTLIGW